MKYLIAITILFSSFNIFAQASTFMTYILDVSVDIKECEIQALDGSRYSNPGKIESIKDGLVTLRITPDRYYLVRINDSLDFRIDGPAYYNTLKAANPNYEADTQINEVIENDNATDETSSLTDASSGSVTIVDAASDELVFRVQLGAYKGPVHNLFKDYERVYEQKIPNTQVTRYMVGSYSNLANAKKALTEILDGPQRRAFVVSYENGKRSFIGK